MVFAEVNLIKVYLQFQFLVDMQKWTNAAWRRQRDGRSSHWRDRRPGRHILQSSSYHTIPFILRRYNNVQLQTRPKGGRKKKKPLPPTFCNLIFFCVESNLALRWQTLEFGLLLFSWKTLLTLPISK